MFLLGYDDALVVTLPDGAVGGDIGFHSTSLRGIARVEGDFGDTDVKLVAALGSDRGKVQLGSFMSGRRVSDLGQLRATISHRSSAALTAIAGVDSTTGRSGLELDSSAGPTESAIEEAEAIATDATLWSADPGAYLKVDWRPSSTSRERWLFEPGLRVDASFLGPDRAASVDPRLAVRWRPVDGTTLRLGAGRYSQAPPIEDRIDFRSGETTGVGLEHATTGSIGVSQDFPGVLGVDATTYYKQVDHLVVSGANPLVGIKDQDGEGRAYGVEVIARRPLSGRLFGWVSYTWSVSQRRDDPSQDWFSYDYDQTHNLVLVASYEVPRVLTFGLKGQYTTGNPYTANTGGTFDVDSGSYDAFAGSRNGARQAPYSSLSARVEHDFPMQHGRATLYLDLLNVVHGENPEAVLYNYDYTESGTLSGLGFVPSLGFDLEFGR